MSQHSLEALREDSQQTALYEKAVSFPLHALQCCTARTEVKDVLEGTSFVLGDGREGLFLEKKSHGGFGDVWVAALQGESATVIAKFVRCQQAEQWLRNEESILRGVHIEGVPRILGSGLSDGRHFLLEEHIYGRTWREVLLDARRRCPLSEFLHRPAELAVILSNLHALGIVHGDVKPENILFGFKAGTQSRPRTWLVDFGLAFSAGNPSPQISGTTLGTRGYIDPWTIGSAEHRNVATDVYGLGSMLFEGYTGLPLFSKAEWNTTNAMKRDHASSHTFAQWCYEHLREKCESFSVLPRRFAKLEDLIRNILQPVIASRPTAGEVAERLLDIVSSL